MASKTLQLAMDTVIKTYYSCTRMKIQVNLVLKIFNHAKIEIEKKTTGALRIEKVTIHYDLILKYYSKYKMQGRTNKFCKILSLH